MSSFSSSLPLVAPASVCRPAQQPLRRQPLAYAVAWFLASLGSNAPAQTPSAAAPVVALPDVTVSASGLQHSSNDMATPVTVLEGDELLQRRQANLGETLNGEPGIHSSHFGAGASRPIIRGMDGPRVRLLSDGAPIHDASTISPDHAVVAEPLLATQIEVLRGPAALTHGGGAIGGVVNVLDGKVPTAIPAKGYEGSAELRASSANAERAGAFSLTGGAGAVAIHVEGSKSQANDYRVGQGWAGGRKVAGSFNDNDSASLGVSWVGKRGYLGLAYSRQNADYGLPGHSHSYDGCHLHGMSLHCGGHGPELEHGDEHHEDEHGAAHGVPVVDLRSERLDVRGELRNPLPGFSNLRLRAGKTDYQHHEKEAGAISTTFSNRAHDMRLEMQHLPVAGWRGVLGVQTSQRRFAAEGEEAYIQPTDTRQRSLFVLEEYRWQNWRFEAALRHEHQTILAAQPGTATSHDGTSAALGAVWRFQPGYQLQASWSHAKRLPTAEELYARGLHLATSTYELGNAQLHSETAQNIDLGLRKTAGDTTFDISLFHNRVKNYIYGRTLEELDGLQLLQYQQQDARFTGLEGRVQQRLGRDFSISLFGDVVRARLDGGGKLPRIPADRVGLRLDGQWQAWQGYTEWVQVARQTRIAAFESETPSYGLLNLGLSYQTRSSSGQAWKIYLRARNLNDRLAYAHSSFIKNAAPLMGRNITLGVRLDF
ncbi:MAG: TonB-dependent receptor [Giesbergeria sp.]|uniref:TonB-dependent receptor domain-containing protein n=1 Tax=Giesbergeria sp. TaxID=2818473 RepID=UPI00262FF575|nr:TonB-dependent receptor [Giesbergeria sp.]MDD2608449.1 TonB-dependent receptor [Giesbergeria sp.]